MDCIRFIAQNSKFQDIQNQRMAMSHLFPIIKRRLEQGKNKTKTFDFDDHFKMLKRLKNYIRIEFITMLT